jgi:cytidyltransferase-like protein
VTNYRSALYAGSFDPLTNGHLEVIRRAAGLFDFLTVFIANRESKKYLFDLKERTDIVHNARPWDRWLARLRGKVIGWLQRRDQPAPAAPQPVAGAAE